MLLVRGEIVRENAINLHD